MENIKKNSVIIGVGNCGSQIAWLAEQRYPELFDCVYINTSSSDLSMVRSKDSIKIKIGTKNMAEGSGKNRSKMKDYLEEDISDLLRNQSFTDVILDKKYCYVVCSAAGGTGSGAGPLHIDYVLGIAKAYTTRVGGGPFPTELTDEIGKGICTRGKEFGAVTGRPRRAGWYDAVAMRRAVTINSLSGIALMKLDVLDGMDEVKICTAYKLPNGAITELPPLAADDYAMVTPVYETMPGWKESTFGVTEFDKLPVNARNYVRRLEELAGVKIAILSTGPERDQTIYIEDPFA